MSQTGLTNDPTVSAMAAGIGDSLMRPQGFCAYRDTVEGEGGGRCDGRHGKVERTGKRVVL